MYKLLFAMLWRIALSYDKDKILKDLLTPMREYGETCAYESCPLAVPNTLNVHVVPHTHGEVGFNHNFHQHYTGEDDFFLPRAMNMKRIFDFVLTELWKDPKRRFTLSDNAYFFHWWANRDATVHRMVYELVRQGRLMFVGGGFSMSDEASVSYQGVIDQFTYSLRKINATFMSCGRPLVAWQAEVFGHSREFASLMAQMGFDALFINPISYDDEVARMRRKGLEFIWRGSDDLGTESDIFTHKLFDGYWSPPGFCFGQLCKDPMIVTSDSQFLNVDERVDRFIESMKLRQSPNYGTHHIMVMMGHRFAYFDANTWFSNIEKLMQFTNKKSREKGVNVTVYYSTPPCYLKAVHESNPNLETKQDDFFPFVYNKDSYAIGIYTSRPTLKYIVREGYVYYQIWKQLQVTANLPMNNKFYEDFNWIMSMIQDHGVLTGTVKDTVKGYYVQKLCAAVTKTTELMSTAFRKLRNSTRHIRYRRCMFNISDCLDSMIIKHSLQIYNPLGWPVTMPVRLPVAPVNAKFRVFDNHGNEVKSVTMEIPRAIINVKDRRYNATHEVVFIATNLPPIGYRSYYVQADYYRPKRAIIKKLKRTKPKKYFARQINPLKIDDDRFNEIDFDDYDAINKKMLLLPNANDSTNVMKDFDYYYDDIEATTTVDTLMNISRKSMVVTTLKTPITTVTTAPISLASAATTDFKLIVTDATTEATIEDSFKDTTTVTTTTKKPEQLQKQNVKNLTEFAEQARVGAKQSVTEKYFKLKDVKNDTLFIGNKVSFAEDARGRAKEPVTEKYFKLKEVENDTLFIGNKVPIAEEARVETKDIPVTEKYFKLKEVENDTLFVGNKVPFAEEARVETKDIPVTEKYFKLKEVENDTLFVGNKVPFADEARVSAKDIPVTEKYFKLKDVKNDTLFKGNKVSFAEEARVRAKDIPVTEKYFKLKDVKNDTLFIGNKYVRLNLDAKKRIASIHLCNGLRMSLKIQLYNYVSDEPFNLNPPPQNLPTRKQPGVLIFRPIDPQYIPMDEGYNATIVKNDIVEEIHMKYNEWAFLNIRLYVDSPVFELMWMIGPIPVEDELGKEVFIRYTTNLDNEGVFYTDSNGRQTIKRIRNTRATYPTVNLQEVEGNIYPVTSKIYIEDLKKNMRFTIFNDRSQGGGSLKDGDINMLIQRRILTDDVGALVTTYLNETDEYGTGIKVTGTHYLYLTKADYKKNRIFEKKFAKEIALAPKVLVSHFGDYKPEIMKSEFYKSRNEFSALKKKLPVGIHLLTLEIWTGGILLRLENYLEKTDTLRTGIKTVYLKELFNNISITSIKEKTLGANMDKNEWSPLQWMKKEKFYKNFNEVYGSSNNVTYAEDFEAFADDADLEKGIKLAPQQIRTFVCEYKYIEN